MNQPANESEPFRGQLLGKGWVISADRAVEPAPAWGHRKHPFCLPATTLTLSKWTF